MTPWAWWEARRAKSDKAGARGAQERPSKQAKHVRFGQAHKLPNLVHVERSLRVRIASGADVATLRIEQHGNVVRDVRNDTLQRRDAVVAEALEKGRVGLVAHRHVLRLVNDALAKGESGLPCLLCKILGVAIEADHEARARLVDALVQELKERHGGEAGREAELARG